MSFNFMAVVIICSDFGAPKIKSDTVSTVSPSISLYNHLILCHPLLLLLSIFPNIRVFSNKSALCFRGPKYRSFVSEVCNTVQEAVTKTTPKKKKCKKAKWLSEEALQTAEGKREVESKGERGRCTQLNAEFQRIAISGLHFF